uniref:Uncharacterized protein n=1 Tax=Oryza sativa subsp. japonica TaxID=39947 RepID=Q10MF0_ORYSJ|nr:hypothetical protein LOC_Os03g19740 [Oryza sativa Japonica Group]
MARGRSTADGWEDMAGVTGRARWGLETVGHWRGGHWRRRGTCEEGIGDDGALARRALETAGQRSSSLLGEWVGVLETTPLRRSSHRASTGGGEAGAGAEELEEGGSGSPALTVDREDHHLWATRRCRRPPNPPPPSRAPQSAA